MEFSKSATRQPRMVLPPEECLAKTVHREDGTPGKGCDVATHLRATFRVAEALLKFLQNTRAGELLERQDLLPALLHDIGKLTPAFQDKIYRALDITYPLMENKVTGENHAASSRAILMDWDMDLDYLADLVGDHHGRVCTGRAHPTHLGHDEGNEAWKANQRTLAETLCREFGLTLEDVPYKWGEPKFRLVQGLTSLADWLSSGLELGEHEEISDQKIAAAVKNAGFVPFRVKSGLSFEQIFGFPPFPVQTLMAENVAPGGVYVLETEMGGGKTEAALFLAYQLLEKHAHNGVYFALPTQLTSDKIHERFQAFLNKILPHDESRRALLLHGKAWLRNDLRVNEEEGFGGKTADRDAWFDHRKRGLLAPFAVGTVDQLLMAVINVRYNFIRAFGAAGKVVILDEIHSYDAYTLTLIKDLILMLREMGCTVILLSATLTRRSRNDFLAKTDATCDPMESSYPLLSVGDGANVRYAKTETPPGKTVSIVSSRELEDSIDRALERAENGECVLWIENTVNDAQEAFKRLRARAGGAIPMGLIHSRFPSFVRAQQEKDWTHIYGKNVTRDERVGGKILVGTQVLEQSLDIDADYLITRLCPTDMLLQRIGRLWRHRVLDAFRPASARCTVEILNEKPYENKPEYREPRYPKHFVYAPYVVMRSQEVWENRSKVLLPHEMRELLEATYADRDETGYYDGLKRERNSREDQLERVARKSEGYSERTKDDDEGHGTRYSEVEDTELLLLEPYDHRTGRLKLYGRKGFLTLPARNASRAEKLLASRILAKHLIRVPEYAAPTYEGFPIDFLSHLLYVGRGTDRPVRAAYIETSGGRLQNFSRLPAETDSGKCELFYSDELGYRYD